MKKNTLFLIILSITTIHAVNAARLKVNNYGKDTLKATILWKGGAETKYIKPWENETLGSGANSITGIKWFYTDEQRHPIRVDKTIPGNPVYSAPLSISAATLHHSILIRETDATYEVDNNGIFQRAVITLASEETNGEDWVFMDK